PLPGTAPVEVAVGSDAARGAASGGAASGGAEPGGVESEGAGSGGAEPGGAESGGAEPEGVELGDAEPGGDEPEGVEPGGATSEGAESGGIEPRGTASFGGAGVTVGAVGTGGSEAAGPGGARSWGTGAAGTSGAGAGGAGAVCPGAGGAGGSMRLRPYFVHLLQHVLGVLFSTGLPPPLLCLPPDQSQPLIQPASPRPAPSPYTEQTGGLIEHREPVSCHASPVALVVSFLVRVLLLSPAHTLWHFVLPFLRLPVPSVGGECALGTDFFEDRHEEFECLAAAVPRFASMLLAPEGDPDAPDIPTPRSYTEAMMGPYSS
ncbi:unnamed protein product, partial [Closterium sp. NIES-54]